LNLKNLPDVEFANKDIEDILSDTISSYEKAYFEQNGTVKKLYPGDPIRIFLYSQALREFQLRQIIDFSAKQNLLKYAKGDYLDNIGATVERLKASKSRVTIKFNMSSPQPTAQIIPIGTRVTPGNNIFFETTENVEIPAGEIEVTSIMECTIEGKSGNGFLPGQINVLVDPVPWVKSVSNIDKSQGGSDIEDDESYRERIWLAPESYSTAGPDGAYKFFAKQYNSSIVDVEVSSPSPGVVDIRVLLENGEIPTQTLLDSLKDYLSDGTKRPLTDYVVVNAPDIVNYDIDIVYYILDEDSAMTSTIQTSVNQAIENYKNWQKSKIGRDINPSKLTADIISSGAHRVEITSPVYTEIQATDIAIDLNVNIVYGGLVNA